MYCGFCIQHACVPPSDGVPGYHAPIWRRVIPHTEWHAVMCATVRETLQAEIDACVEVFKARDRLLYTAKAECYASNAMNYSLFKIRRRKQN